MVFEIYVLTDARLKRFQWAFWGDEWAFESRP